MSITTRTWTVSTSHGLIAGEESGRGEVPVLFIHGNSSCREVFQRQLRSQLSDCHRLIAIDLPGHGRSGDAPDPERSYTRPGLADAVIELLTILNISQVVVVGWSLGGHVGIEMMPRLAGMRGLMITGTPPIGRGGMADGFLASPVFHLAGRPSLADADVDTFARAMFGEPVEPFLRKSITRADGRFREKLFEAGRAGVGTDQRLIVENSLVPVAVVNGTDDKLIKLDYVESVTYGNLWSGQCHRMSGVGHAPFWHASAAYNSIIERFLEDVG